MYIFTSKMKLLCLTMWLGGLYTDDDADTDIDGQSMIVSLVDNPNEPIKPYSW